MNTPAATLSSTTTWNLDSAHSSAEFKVKHMMISNVKGQFAKVAGVLTMDDSGVKNSYVEATIDVSSIVTRDEQRDGHLKGADFFDVQQYPKMTFKSTGVKVAGSGEGTVEGDLTIRDVTRKVVFDVEGPSAPTKDPWGNLRIGVSATTRISRKDFGLIWNTALETGGVLVGDDVAITLDVEFVKT